VRRIAQQYQASRRFELRQLGKLDWDPGAGRFAPGKNTDSKEP